MEGRLEQTNAAYLDVLVECAKHVIDLVLESTGQHLISFVQHKHLDVADVCQQRVDSCHRVSPERQTARIQPSKSASATPKTNTLTLCMSINRNGQSVIKHTDILCLSVGVQLPN